MIRKLNRTISSLRSLKFNRIACFGERIKLDISKVPNLEEFLHQNTKKHGKKLELTDSDLLNPAHLSQDLGKSKEPKKFFIETYGCQMNENDTEIVAAIMANSGYIQAKASTEANIIFLNTCAIRENAESKVWNRLQELRALKSKIKKENQLIIGVLGSGCMAERVKEKLVEKNKAVDIVVGPDAYRDLPHLVKAIEADNNIYGINVQLSFEETYADIVPVRTNPDSHSAFISIMRGCNNMCSFCIVPFTRGRERSRPIQSIVDEVKMLRDQGIKEITLLGQNVNSYFDSGDDTVEIKHENSQGFAEMYKLRDGTGARFDTLLSRCAEEAPDVRFRFTSPHPKDFPERVLEVIKSYNNICKNIHMPAQSGNTEVLKRMRRNYTREAYLELADSIRTKIPSITFSTDMICGFCGETDEEFEDTISLMEIMKYEQAYLFAYSMREKTHAHRNYLDDVLPEAKQKRLERMIETFHKNQAITTEQELNRYHLVLIEGGTKKEGQIKGRTDTNRVAVMNSTVKIPQVDSEFINKWINSSKNKETFEELFSQRDSIDKSEIKKGEYVIVRCDDHSSRTLYTTPIAKANINQFGLISNDRPFMSF